MRNDKHFLFTALITDILIISNIFITIAVTTLLLLSPVVQPCKHKQLVLAKENSASLKSVPFIKRFSVVAHTAADKRPPSI